MRDAQIWSAISHDIFPLIGVINAIINTIIVIISDADYDFVMKVFEKF